MIPAPTTVPGRPDIPNAEVAKTLRGVPAPPFPTPAEKLQIGQLKMPKGFKLEVYISGIANARSLRIGDKGTVFVSNRQLD
ncbi:MAG: sorbosone dehydrogenase family protein, partial [Candidatus Binatia bacterium]